MISSSSLVSCPGCGLERPASGIAYDRKFHASAECWALFEQVIGREFESAVLFGQAHQLTVDAYAVQHAGGGHPDKSVAIHLAGLHLSLERGLRLWEVPAWLQRIAAAAPGWPHLEPPAPRPRGLSIRNVAESRSPDRHVEAVRAWAAQVWETWRPHHAAARALAELGASPTPPTGGGTDAPRTGGGTDPRGRRRTVPRA
ncbi:MAG TPA: DUF5946 family protein [Candidatus Polarisedimenticolia bacterium]|nr:DUF5946 family protein [Candidatus Polarisedimenticolia bacterium]